MTDARRIKELREALAVTLGALQAVAPKDHAGLETVIQIGFEALHSTVDNEKPYDPAGLG